MSSYLNYLLMSIQLLTMSNYHIGIADMGIDFIIVSLNKQTWHFHKIWKVWRWQGFYFFWPLELFLFFPSQFVFKNLNWGWGGGRGHQIVTRTRSGNHLQQKSMQTTISWNFFNTLAKSMINSKNKKVKRQMWYQDANILCLHFYPVHNSKQILFNRK